MQNIYLSEISNYDGKEVMLRGWLKNKRSSGKIHFLIIRDGTGVIQGVMGKKDVSPEVFALGDELKQESSIEVTGTVRADKRAPSGYELLINNLKIIHLAEDFPITPKEHGPDFLMDHRHLWLRSSGPYTVLKVRNEVIKACRDFFYEKGFVLIDTPILTPAACEGTTTLFETDYFGEKAYLAQSGQLYLEAAIFAFNKVYCFGPTFRAEKSKTRRHLTEFWMIEAEAAFMELDDSMKLQEEMITYIVKRVLANCKTELAELGRDTSILEQIEPPFPRLSYQEAVDILKSEGVDFQWGNDLGGNDETILANRSPKPVFVHRYPTSCKAFYMKPDPENLEVALCADLLAPEGYGEIIGGSQRIDDLELLLKRIEEHHLPQKAFEWYLDLRRYGSVPHSGFGLGIERTVTWLCGIKHVRETIPFPRTIYRLYP